MIETTYDYLVVGGGAAGCVLAARLAAESNASVALIERGRTDTNRWIHIPATFFKALQSQDAETIVSEADPSLDDGVFPVPQGRVLGGGSSVNGMIYMRGQAQDYDDWVEHYGCEGWGYKDVLAINSGIAASDDFNGVNQEGAGWYQVTAFEGQRQSSAFCFLKPELHRENLSVLTNVQAAKIRIKGRRAVALEARRDDGSEIVFNATKEIILTAGSFQSPKLLMLSGVGPKEHLSKHGIDIVCDSPLVGSNYQDHVGTPVTRELRGARGLYGADKGIQALTHGLKYVTTKGGLLASNLLDAGACVDTSGCGRPDVQFNMAPFAPSCAQVLAANWALSHPIQTTHRCSCLMP